VLSAVDVEAGAAEVPVMEVSGEPGAVERRVVRLVVLDVGERLLLFHTHDPVDPGLGQWWELPGGGIEDGETYLEAAIRELAEEAGIVVSADQVSSPDRATRGPAEASCPASVPAAAEPRGPLGGTRGRDG
jgi:8-oxo-dGTP pyrophosphatase MutT (NUDIX family)